MEPCPTGKPTGRLITFIVGILFGQLYISYEDDYSFGASVNMAHTHREFSHRCTCAVVHVLNLTFHFGFVHWWANGRS